MHEIDERLEALGLVLPETAAPVANYVPYHVAGGLIYVSGQLAFRDGVLLHPGVVGVDITLEQAREAARLCGLNLLAQAKAACQGDWDRLGGCLKLGGFVQSPAGFGQQPEVINGASDLMVEILGEAGRHTRYAVGASSLPRNASVEIEGIFRIDS